MAHAGVRYLATRSRPVYERMILANFEQEFAKQQQVQAIKTLILVTSFTCLAMVTVVAPMHLSRFILGIML